MQCLEKEPERRPQSARELAEEFQAAIGVYQQTRAGPTIVSDAEWLR